MSIVPGSDAWRDAGLVPVDPHRPFNLADDTDSTDDDPSDGTDGSDDDREVRDADGSR